MKIEHYLYADGVLINVDPVSKTDVASKPIGDRSHGHFHHIILLIIEEEWPYPFCVRTEIEVENQAQYTWFAKLADLLDYQAKYLPPEREVALR